jgi:hypothetical protein
MKHLHFIVFSGTHNTLKFNFKKSAFFYVKLNTYTTQGTFNTWENICLFLKHPPKSRRFVCSHLECMSLRTATLNALFLDMVNIQLIRATGNVYELNGGKRTWRMCTVFVETVSKFCNISEHDNLWLTRSCTVRLSTFFWRLFSILALRSRPVCISLQPCVRVPRGYVKTSYGVCKTEKKKLLFSDKRWKSRPDLRLVVGDSDVRTFDFREPFHS